MKTIQHSLKLLSPGILLSFSALFVKAAYRIASVKGSYSFYAILILLGLLAFSLLFLLPRSVICNPRFLLMSLLAHLFAVNSYAQTYPAIRIGILSVASGNLNDVIAGQCFNGLCVGTDPYQYTDNNGTNDTKGSNLYIFNRLSGIILYRIKVINSNDYQSIFPNPFIS